jgi:hypothetical protein
MVMIAMTLELGCLLVTLSSEDRYVDVMTIVLADLRRRHEEPIGAEMSMDLHATGTLMMDVSVVEVGHALPLMAVGTAADTERGV